MFQLCKTQTEDIIICWGSLDPEILGLEKLDTPVDFKIHGDYQLVNTDDVRAELKSSPVGKLLGTKSIDYVLRKHNVNTYNKLLFENHKIKAKLSNLPSNVRKIIPQRVEEINNHN